MCHHKLMKKLVLIISILIALPALSVEKPESKSAEQASLKEDFFESFNLLGKGAGLQFSEAPSIFLGATGLIGITAAFLQKDKIENGIREEPASDVENFISDMNIVFSFPLIPLTTWYVAKKYNNQKLRMFAKEYFATLYLTKAEVFTLSFIPINKRPNSDGINAFEKYFRGKSSFPSGHMVPASTLFWKTFQYYGPVYSVAPLAWSILTGYQRVNSKRHHITDVVGTFFLAGMASEGVRIAAGHKNNHPLYKWIFEHRLSFNFFKGKDAWQTTIDFTF